ncbi:S26 family signal peptidase [Streptomyces sp. NPDC059166]|uniref:S26 family signal peptidase n=1 Tax=Streptomyces sp. NPDC059166 TaxID=3346752 RepID=UPI0036AFDF6F
MVGAAAIRRTFMLISVIGESMSPTYNTGDRVLIRRGSRSIRRGQVVVVIRPAGETGWAKSQELEINAMTRTWSIKRVAAIGGDDYPTQVRGQGKVPAGHILVIGDDPLSIDSKRHGPCPRNQVIGVLVARRAKYTTAPT